MTIRYILYITAFLQLFLVSCEKKETAFAFPLPKIFSSDAAAELAFVQEPGKMVQAELSLQAAAGLALLRVENKADLHDEVRFIADELAASYNFSFQVPADAALGSSYTFQLTLSDRNEQTTTFPITVRVDATYSLRDEQVGGRSVKVISGKINGSFHFAKADTYVVDGPLSIEDGGQLSIDAGSNVYFRSATSNAVASRLIITRGSRLQAIGTAQEPIVFSSEKVLRGEEPSFADWGGIFLMGRAPSNRGANVIEDGFAYGGTAASESSGQLRYLRIEYAGMGDFHALNLFGVGASTLLENIQVFHCQNNAFRIRGGRVNLRYIAGIDHGGYGLWADEGWQGKGQFWLFQTNIPATLVPLNFWNQARALEIRNHDSFYDTAPRTTFQIANVTLIGNGESAADGTRRGARVRRGAIGQLRNMLVAHFASDGVRVEDLPIERLGQDMLLDNVRAFRSGVNYAQEAESFFFQTGRYDVSEAPVEGIGLDSYVGSAASPFNPSALDPWFVPASYIGAVQNASNDWTRQGIWFKNRNGSIRQ